MGAHVVCGRCYGCCGDVLLLKLLKLLKLLMLLRLLLLLLLLLCFASPLTTVHVTQRIRHSGPWLEGLKRH